jgi:hypothetical protein
MFEETCMKNAGLILCSVSAASIALARQRLAELSAFIVSTSGSPTGSVSHEQKKIAIVDLCSSSDVHPEQLKAEAIRKQDGCAPLVLDLNQYIDKGWTVQVFWWLVGICGLIDPPLIVSLLTFLDIPRKHRKTAVERTVLASVKALYFMHQVRFEGMYCRKRAAENRQNNFSDDEVTDDEELLSGPRGRRRKKLAQATCRKPAGPQRVLISSATARHTTAERVSPTSEQAVANPIAEEAAIYNTT